WPGVFDRAAFLGRRDEVVLRLLLDTGVRVSELCGLDLTDVDLDRELAYVTGKGSRPRVVPFGAKTAQAGVADVHPHRFRHTFAHRWLAGGGQERDLMMLAGWRSDDMLSRYAAS